MVVASVCLSRICGVVLCVCCSMLFCYVVFACLAMRPASCGLIFLGCVVSLLEQCVVFVLCCAVVVCFPKVCVNDWLLCSMLLCLCV